MVAARWDVEVRKDAAGDAWYAASLLDMTTDGFVCRLEGDVFPREAPLTVPGALVRLKAAPLSSSASKAFQPNVGELVELEERSSADAAPCWRRVRVKSSRSGFFLVAPANTRDNGALGEVIVPKSRLRPCPVELATSASLHLCKMEEPVNPALVPWVRTPEAARAFARVEHVGICAEDDEAVPGFVVVNVVAGPSSGDAGLHSRSEAQVSVCLLGTRQTLRVAKVLVHAAFQHQLQTHAWEQAQKLREHALRERKLHEDGQGLSHASSHKEYAVTKEFETDYRQASIIIGANGARVKALQRQHDVFIDITDTLKGRKNVQILGRSESDVAAVVDITEVIEESIDVEPEMAAWAWGTVGKKSEMLKEIEDDAGLQSCRLLPGSGSEGLRLLISGTRSGCRQARVLFEARMSYYEPFRSIAKEKEKLAGQAQEVGLDRPGLHGLGLGKGNGKGRDGLRECEGLVSPDVRRARPSAKSIPRSDFPPVPRSDTTYGQGYSHGRGRWHGRS